MRRISWRSSSGIGGRPGLDLTRQNRRQPARCQRIRVSGRTTTGASRQAKSRARDASDTRVAASTRLGLTPRSWYSASSRRRNRFSASMKSRRLSESTTRQAKSSSNRKTIRASTITRRSCHSSPTGPQRRQFLRDRILAEHREPCDRSSARPTPSRTDAERTSVKLSTKTTPTETHAFPR